MDSEVSNSPSPIADRIDGLHEIVSIQELVMRDPQNLPPQLENFTIVRTLEGRDSQSFRFTAPPADTIFLGVVCDSNVKYEVRLLDAEGQQVTFFGGNACTMSGGDVVGYFWPLKSGSSFTSIEVDVPTGAAYKLSVLSK